MILNELAEASFNYNDCEVIFVSFLASFSVHVLLSISSLSHMCTGLQCLPVTLSGTPCRCL